MQARSKRQNDTGFTLIEVLIAIVILSVGLLGMASLTVGIIKGNKTSNNFTMAATCAQDKLEDFQRLGYSGIPATDTTVTEDYNSMTGYGEFKRVTLTTVDSPEANMKTVTVTVYWDSDAHSLVLNTILSQ